MTVAEVQAVAAAVFAIIFEIVTVVAAVIRVLGIRTYPRALHWVVPQANQRAEALLVGVLAQLSIVLAALVIVVNGLVAGVLAIVAALLSVPGVVETVKVGFASLPVALAKVA